ncbi:putative transcriptional regulatory protein [Colletotrichum fructicola]|nr:putative transcriptional regulatory protein [Colletotrichum fructicola]
MLLLGWNKCANQKPLLDIKRPWLSGFTTVNWSSCQRFSCGDELDFTAPEIWKWYNTFDSEGIPKRKVYGCTRYTYNSSTGSIRFPTCPIADDPIAVISAGVSAAQESFGVCNASVRVVESLFKGSTGSVLPLGFEGISAFSNVKFMSWDPSMANQSQQFNYSLTQQGLSADVTCQETSNTPIQTQLLKSMEVTNSNAGGTMELRRFIVNQSNCGSNHTFVVPGIGVVAPGFCQPDAMVKKYVLYLTPMGRYSRAPLSLPNMTCTFEPMITKNIVGYSTDTGLFTSSVIERMGGSGIPNETADAINSLFMISTTSWGSGLIDSMLSLNTSGDGSGNFSYAGAVEAAMRGIIEYEGTNLRIYYAANEADGRSTVNGTYEVFRMGYHQTTPTALLIALPLIVYILVVAWWYTWTGLRTGSSIDDEFNPTNSTALVTAAAAGATNGKLGLDGRGGLNDHLVQGVSPVMSALGAEDGAGPDAPLAAEPAGSRVWQACLACRRKKIKCDGKQPCHNCSSRDQTCEFPGTKDNASASRYYTTSFEARCQQMDSMCQRLETLTSQLSQSLEAMHQSPGAGSLASPSEDLLRAAQVLNSLPNVQESVLGLRNASHVQGPETGNLDGNIHANRVLAPLLVRQSHVNDDLLDLSDSDDSDTNNDQRQDGPAEGRDDDEIGQVGALLPMDMKDEDFEPYYLKSRTYHPPKVDIPPEGSCIMSGFLAFARLSRLAGKIQHLNSPLNLRKLASADSAKTQRFFSRVDTYDQALRNWLASLPPHIQFSANSMEKSPGGDPALVMCVVIFILHAGSLLNLYRCFLNYPKQAALDEEVDISGAISQCVSAAQISLYDALWDRAPADAFKSL